MRQPEFQEIVRAGFPDAMANQSFTGHVIQACLQPYAAYHGIYHDWLQIDVRQKYH